MNGVIKTIPKTVICYKCKRQGIIISPYSAPKGWRRQYFLTANRYIYLCKDCYVMYIKGNPLFDGD